eukprot:s2135_g19.t1
MPSPFHDRDAEDVKKKALEEKSEEREQLTMGQEDKRPQVVQFEMDQPQVLEDGSMAMDPSELPSSSTARRPERPGDVVLESGLDDDEVVDFSHLPAMESQVDVIPDDPGLSAPVTPPMTSDHDAKRAKLEAQTKQKITQVMEFNESMIRTVKVGTDEFATLDDYSTELTMDDEPLEEDDYWVDDQLQFSDVPEALWSEFALDKQLPPPERWVDQLADSVEINRLLSMGVLQKREETQDEVSGTLTTRFVYD